MYKKILSVFMLVIASLPATAAEFSFIDTQGETQSLSRYRGQWVLLNLWATWCSPCLAEMPELEALHQSHKNLVVLGLAVDGQSTARVKQFAEKLHITYPVIAGTAESAAQFKTRGYPTSFLFDALGKQVFFKEGVVTRTEIDQIVRGMAIDQQRQGND